MTQSLALSCSTKNSEKLNQAGFNFPPGVIVPVIVQWVRLTGPVQLTGLIFKSISHGNLPHFIFHPLSHLFLVRCSVPVTRGCFYLSSQGQLGRNALIWVISILLYREITSLTTIFHLAGRLSLPPCQHQVQNI